MSQMGKEEFQKELAQLEDLYEQTTGEKMAKFYRPPQGKYSDNNLQLAKELGYRTIFWSLAYVDWKQEEQPTHEEAMSKLLKRDRKSTRLNSSHSRASRMPSSA